MKTPVANLIRYVPSGTYFARVRVGGKLIRQSLKTDRISVARLRLTDLVKEERENLEARAEATKGRMTFGEALAIYRDQVEGNPAIKPTSKLYRRKCIAALLKSWPELEETDVKRISERDCLAWASRFAKSYSPSVYNNTVGTLRQVLALASDEGARYGNPAMKIKKVKVRSKTLHLPTHEQFAIFTNTIASAGAWCSEGCADLVRFLAFGGFRKGEAASVTWADCDFEREEILVRGDAETGTKNWTVRRVPMIPDMRQLLERLRGERPDEQPATPVMKVRECQKAMDRAAKTTGMHRITHHDLRHLFATRCIESGVDIPTLSRWLGHKDGGALAMKVYGHLRNQHSQEMAQKVKF
ncbi:MAG TPA: site-specific integrase [Verrucomicrobiota bacterium]|nr:site-specific integrase [Verrucomicrobiota bacterium]HRZ58528.1 site-specific integrase [Candidatus Paceibacterota bacterium]